MEKCYKSPLKIYTLLWSLMLLTGLFMFELTAQAQQADHPFSIELNAGGGLIGNSNANTAFQPELGVSYMPGRWGVGLDAGLYSFGSGFNAEQYRTGYEQFTIAEQSSDDWNAISINAGPRFEQSLSRFMSLNLGLDLAMNYQKGPSQSVRFNDPTGELESSGIDSDIVLAEMDGDAVAGWTAAIRPQLQMEFKPGFSDRFSFNIKTGIQHHLSDREITYTERDLSQVRQVDSAFEMHHQFENAPIVQRTETAPKTNFFANAGIKISFGGSRAPAAPGQDYNATRSNKPVSIANDGGGDCDDDDPRCTPGSSRAQDYNSSRSNKPNTEISDDIWDDCDDDGSCPHPDELLHRAKELELASAGNDIQNIKEVLDRCDEGVCGQVRQHADDRHHEVESALENPTEIDTHIEEILNIVKEDVESLGKCETDVCREVLVMEEQLLVKMNRLSDIAKLAPVQDYNATRSNKPTSIADGVGDGDPDSDDDGIDEADTRKVRLARLANPTGLIVKTGMVAAGGNPLYQGNTSEGENPLYEGQANDGDADNNDDDNLDPSTVQKYELQPSSYCMKISTNSQQGMRSDAQSHNSSRSNRTEGVAKPDLDGDGFPDIMKSASFSISKRSARTGRNPNYNLKDDKKRKGLNAVNVKVKGIVDNGDADGDGYGDAVGFHFDLEIDPIDPDDDGDGLGDVIESASYSISKRSARTGRNESQENPLAKESGWQEVPALETAPPNNVHQWSYDLKSLDDGQGIPGGTLTVLFTGGSWHFDVQVDHFDPDDDGDGLGDLLQNSSFSISKRSARTGRNPQTGKEIE